MICTPKVSNFWGAYHYLAVIYLTAISYPSLREVTERNAVAISST